MYTKHQPLGEKIYIKEACLARWIKNGTIAVVATVLST
jgi:hypothetical protein